MGYFNYLLRRILNKIPLKILIIILIVIFLLCNCCFATDTTVINNSNSDAYNYYLVQADISWHRLLYREIKLAQNSHTFDSNFLYFLQTIFQNDIARAWYVCIDDCYYHILDEDYANIYNTRDDIYFGYCSFYNETQRSETKLFASPSYSSNYNVSREVLAFNYTNQATVYCFTNNNTTNILTNRRLCIPSGLERYIPNDLYDDLYNIHIGQFSFENSDKLLEQINQHLDNIDDFLQDESISSYSSNDLPSENTTDITSTGFSNIFTTFQNAFTQDVASATFTLPFINTPFTIHSSTTYYALENANLGVFVDFIYMLWYFGISYYIIRDIYRYINDVKNGNISKTDTNIKTDML